MIPPGFPVKVDGLEGSLADQGRIVLKRLGAGEITPEHAATVISVVSAQARIIEVDELEKRIAALEQQRGRCTASPATKIAAASLPRFTAL